MDCVARVAHNRSYIVDDLRRKTNAHNIIIVNAKHKPESSARRSPIVYTSEIRFKRLTNRVQSVAVHVPSDNSKCTSTVERNRRARSRQRVQ